MSKDGYTLFIGDKNLSSWSLRPWIAVKHCGIPFAEERIRLRQPESREAILRHSPSGKVPALKANGLVVFDSLAILEYLAERHPELRLWPRDEEARALARSVSAEMHSGFVTPAQRHVDGAVGAAANPADKRRACPRHQPHRGDLARDQDEARRGRSLPVRRLLERRCHVRAGGDPIPHLWHGSCCLRRRRHRSVLCRNNLALPEMAEWTEGAEAEIRARKAG